MEPPDIDDLAWGGIMGTVEATVFGAAASALVDALARSSGSLLRRRSTSRSA